MWLSGLSIQGCSFHTSNCWGQMYVSCEKLTGLTWLVFLARQSWLISVLIHSQIKKMGAHHSQPQSHWSNAMSRHCQDLLTVRNKHTHNRRMGTAHNWEIQYLLDSAASYSKHLLVCNSTMPTIRETTRARKNKVDLRHFGLILDLNLWNGYLQNWNGRCYRHKQQTNMGWMCC